MYNKFIYLHFAAIAQDVRIITQPQDVVARLGDALDLPCEVSGDVTSDPTYKFEWNLETKNAENIPIYQNPPSELFDDVKYNVTGTYNLHIDDLQFSHAGTYSCGLQYMSRPLEAILVVMGMYGVLLLILLHLLSSIYSKH